MAHSRDFRSKVALITGSSSGIGEGIAIQLSSFGCEVVITGRNASRVAKVASLCEEVSPDGKKPLQVVADLSKEEDTDLLITKTIEHFQKLDILVNNAGIFTHTVLQTADYFAKYDEIMNTNTRSLVYLTRKCIPYLIESKGNIVNISTVSAFMTFRDESAYSMSKCSIDNFTKSVAHEFGPKGVRCNSINAGFIKTPIFEKCGKMVDFENWKKTYPLRRIGEPIDVAKAVAFLASDDASFITGSNLLVEGGCATHLEQGTFYDF